MNARELVLEMRNHGENGKILSKAMGLTEQGFSKKKRRGGFSQAQIKFIADRYEMTEQRICEVFDLKGGIEDVE